MTNLDLTIDVIDLEKYGINGASEVVYNPSYDLLFEEKCRKVIDSMGITIKRSDIMKTLDTITNNENNVRKIVLKKQDDK